MHRENTDNLRAVEPLQELQDAIDSAERIGPLPRCRHGKALKDGAGELLEPRCAKCGHTLEGNDAHFGISHIPFSKAHPFRAGKRIKK